LQVAFAFALRWILFGDSLMAIFGDSLFRRFSLGGVFLGGYLSAVFALARFFGAL
jgi:hypothetical protein